MKTTSIMSGHLATLKCIISDQIFSSQIGQGWVEADQSWLGTKTADYSRQLIQSFHPQQLVEHSSP